MRRFPLDRPEGFRGRRFPPTLPGSSGGRMAEADGAGWIRKLKRSIGQIGPVRLLATLLFLAAGLYIARFSPEMRLGVAAERALYD